MCDAAIKAVLAHYWTYASPKLQHRSRSAFPMQSSKDLRSYQIQETQTKHMLNPLNHGYHSVVFVILFEVIQT